MVAEQILILLQTLNKSVPHNYNKLEYIYANVDNMQTLLIIKKIYSISYNTMLHVFILHCMKACQQ